MNKDGLGWRRLARITNDELEKFWLNFTKMRKPWRSTFKFHSNWPRLCACRIDLYKLPGKMFVCSLPRTKNELLLVLLGETVVLQTTEKLEIFNGCAILHKIYTKTLLASSLNFTACPHRATNLVTSVISQNTSQTSLFSTNKGFVVTVVFTLRTMWYFNRITKQCQSNYSWRWFVDTLLCLLFN